MAPKNWPGHPVMANTAVQGPGVIRPRHAPDLERWASLVSLY